MRLISPKYPFSLEDCIETAATVLWREEYNNFKPGLPFTVQGDTWEVIGSYPAPDAELTHKNLTEM